jgi:pyruvate kinase
VANAVFDGTDAVMLSAETATGHYPRETVAMMSRIVVEAESNMAEFTQPRRRQQRRLSIAEAICESIAHAAEDLHMGAIAVFTETGNTAILISKYRPLAEIYAFCRTLTVCNRLNLLWGVQPVVRDQALTAEEMLLAAEQELLRRGRVKTGDVLGVVAGTQMASGSTNFMRLHLVTAEEERGISRQKRRTTRGMRHAPRRRSNGSR